MASLLQKEDRLQNLSFSFKMKLFGFLFELLLSSSEKSDDFSIFNEICQIFSIIYLKFPNEHDFLPSPLLNDLKNYKNINGGGLFKTVLAFISKIIFTNTEKTNAELIEINDFLILQIENEIDPFILSSYVNICMKLHKNPDYIEHHEQLLANILSIYDKILELDTCKNSLSIVIFYCLYGIFPKNIEFYNF